VEKNQKTNYYTFTHNVLVRCNAYEKFKPTRNQNAYTVKIKKIRFDYASYNIMSYRISGQSQIKVKSVYIKKSKTYINYFTVKKNQKQRNQMRIQ